MGALARHGASVAATLAMTFCRCETCKTKSRYTVSNVFASLFLFLTVHLPYTLTKLFKSRFTTYSSSDSRLGSLLRHVTKKRRPDWRRERCCFTSHKHRFVACRTSRRYTTDILVAQDKQARLLSSESGHFSLIRCGTHALIDPRPVQYLIVL